ncbi:MAG: FliI/YscN family ATPase [Beijerinckiaceae bacterium]
MTERGLGTTADSSLSPDILRRMLAAVQSVETRVVAGEVLAVSGTLVKARLPRVQVGEVCELKDSERSQVRIAEVIGIDGDVAYLAPYGNMTGMSQRTEVIGLNRTASVGVSDALLGCVLDGYGNVIDAPSRPVVPARASAPKQRSLFAPPPSPLQRPSIDEPIALGIRAIDALNTCGRGQRIGIFGNAGVGKSTLISEIVAGTDADIVVVALIGERGREVGDFLRRVLNDESRSRTIIVASTSDRPPVERTKAAQLATTIAEHYRDNGNSVLLVLDSVTRFARALREIGLSAGEVPARRGYPPSVFSALPQLFERSGTSRDGSITALYTVLVEGDISLDPIAEETKSLLDGHIILSEKLASTGHFPAIDVMDSRSRLMDHIVPPAHKDAANAVREAMARHREVELLIRVGEYKQGHDLEVDRAIRMKPAIDSFLRQPLGDQQTLKECVHRLQELAGMR